MKLIYKTLILLCFTPTAHAESGWWPGMVYEDRQLSLAPAGIEVEPWRRACAEIFQDILSIQDKREKIRTQMKEDAQLYKARKLCKPIPRFFGFCQDDLKFSRIHNRWLQQENYLATKVNALYAQGDVAGCFVEVGA